METFRNLLEVLKTYQKLKNLLELLENIDLNKKNKIKKRRTCLTSKLVSIGANGFPQQFGISTSRARELYKLSLAKILPPQKVAKMSTHSSKRGGCQQLFRKDATGEVIDGHCGFKSRKSKMANLDKIELSKVASNSLH